jgi:sugar phosphate isomerase/epimerase
VRLGGLIYRPGNIAELDALIETFDTFGLSALVAPIQFADMTDDEAVAYGDHARGLGMSIAEALHRPNLMIRDADTRTRRIEQLRRGLRKADLMRADSVVILVGTVGEEDHLAAPHPYMFTDDCRAEFREVILRALDGLELKTTRLLIEPWTTSFFYQPGDIREFLDSVGHPSVGVHLDLVNMISQQRYYRTTELVHEAFDLLEPYIGGIHIKDLLWDWKHMLLKFDEVPIGDGVVDHRALLERAARLDPDMSCFTEHLATEAEYAICFARLHFLADQVGSPFVRRTLPAG